MGSHGFWWASHGRGCVANGRGWATHGQLRPWAPTFYKVPLNFHIFSDTVEDGSRRGQ